MSQIVEVLAFISLSTMCKGEGINLRMKGIQLEELSADIFDKKLFHCYLLKGIYQISPEAMWFVN